MFYVGFCAVCGEGTLGIRMCAGQKGERQHGVVLCDECDAVWTTLDTSQAPVFPEQPDLPCPICSASLVRHAAHWATAEEIDRLQWRHAVIGEGWALGDELD